MPSRFLIPESSKILLKLTGDREPERIASAPIAYN